MNRENVERLIEAFKLEELVERDIGFNMSCWYADVKKDDIKDRMDGCGTTACIAGWCLALKHPKWSAKRLSKWSDEEGDVLTEAAEWLGIHYDTASNLFIPDGENYWNMDKIKPKHAIKALKMLLKNDGEFESDDWAEIL